MGVSWLMPVLEAIRTIRADLTAVVAAGAPEDAASAG
jgi:hypothetical protein